jgi:hypothetical protein
MRLLLTGGRTLEAQGFGGGSGMTLSLLNRMADGSPPPFTAALVLVGSEVASVSVDPSGPRIPTLPAPDGRFAVVIPATDGTFPIRYDARGHVLP